VDPESLGIWISEMSLLVAALVLFTGVFIHVPDQELIVLGLLTAVIGVIAAETVSAMHYRAFKDYVRGRTESAVSLKTLEKIIFLLKNLGKLYLVDIRALTNLTEEDADRLVRILEEISASKLSYDRDAKTLSFRRD